MANVFDKTKLDAHDLEYRAFVKVADCPKWDYTGLKFSKFPPNLLLFWKSSNHTKSEVGATPVYSGTPAVDASGLAPASGLSFPKVTIPSEGTLAVQFKATKNSSEITTEIQLFGPIYVSSIGLIADDGINKVILKTTWKNNDVVTAFIQVSDGRMRIGRV